ncbi:undecaprenyl diphosphate synthase family protein [Ktedonospora formicarum]|uniref:Uncharacterized protein n=1 Tax=Ktedonospora formicarum TaxID=2778364 RepID=A0A8J3HZL1_9CHLR|nr:hypothetical protein KSX_53100 [Ktedonospora formicarum]
MEHRPKTIWSCQGAEKLEEILHWCYELGIHIVSVWCLSLNNFQRDRAEIDVIFDLVKKKSGDFVQRSDV